MVTTRTAAGLAVAGLLASSALFAATPAQADIAPQEKDVVATGSDILQTAFNFIADGYGDLPGYNTAGNRYRFFNFDSTGDAQGRSAYIDPRLLAKQGYLYNGNVINQAAYDNLTSAQKLTAKALIKQEDVAQQNPTIALRAGQDLVVRPSGGGAGGRDAIINDFIDGDGVGNWIDVGRSPDPVDASGTANQETAQTKLGTKLYSVQFGTDRQVIATAAETNAPATLSAKTIRAIYSGSIKTWGDIPGYTGDAGSETIIPLTLPDDAGMWNTFRNGVAAATGGAAFSDSAARQNPNSFNVQQNDPTAIATLPEAQRKNAIVPFPKSRYTVVNKGYYTVAADGAGNTNAYNTARTYTAGKHRKPADASAIKLLAADSTATGEDAPYGTNFALRAIFRESDLNSTTPWQPGSSLNWVRTLFYNPDSDVKPFVDTPAGRALVTAAGQVPTYRVFGTDNQEITQE